MTRLVLLLFAAFAAAYAQAVARVSLSNGVQLTVSARADSNTPIALKASMAPASGDSFYRIFRDQNDLAVFAYELEITRTADGQNIRVTAKAATDDFAKRFPNADGGKPTPTLSSPLESPLLNSGDQFAIPIPSDPGLGQNISDSVRILLGQSANTVDGAGRNGQIRFAGLKVSIQGQAASPSGAGSDVAGKYAMFYLPGHGGYFFSAEPLDEKQFLGVGVVDGKHLTFTIENEVYDCTATASILPQADRGQLWVFHDPDYKPLGNWTKSDLDNNREEFFTAAANSIQWWLP